MLKILHTGDLHLDSPLSSLDFSVAEKIRDEQRHAFEKMMRYAIENDIDMVLIAGDLFDGKYISANTKELAVSLFSEFKKPIIIAPGNHDPYSLVPFYRSDALPKNVFVFSSEELQRFDFDELDVSVFGYAFVTPSLEHSPLASYTFAIMGNRIRLLCAHADTTAPVSKYAPVSVSDIERFDFDYAALGHVHNPPQIESKKTPINYCGFLFGRSFDELGDGGAYVVSVDGEQASAERVKFSEHCFLREELDVSGVSSAKEISDKISEYILGKGYGKNVSLRLTLIGSVPFDIIINEKALESTSSEISELQIRNNTFPLHDSDYLMRDPSLRGELYRTLLPKLSSDDPDERQCATKALRLGLCAIDGISLTSILGIDENESNGGAV